MKSRVAVIKGPGQDFSVEEVEMDDPGPGEVLVKIVATGVCHTDIVVQAMVGAGEMAPPAPMALGHEGAGIVERVGEGVTKVQPGDHVVLSFYYCGKCGNCRSGHPGYCENFLLGNFFGTRIGKDAPRMTQGDQVVHGGFFGQSSFGTYALAYEQNTVKVRDDAPLEMLGPLGCGIQTGAGTVMNVLKPEPGTSIAVFGAGSVGLAGIMAAHLMGAGMIIAVDLKQNRLDLAQVLGATHVVKADEADPIEAIKSMTGDGVRYALEATGVPTVVNQSFKVLASPGDLAVVGAAPQGTAAEFNINDLTSGRTVHGVIEGDSVPDVLIPRLVDLFMQGRFPFDKLVKHFSLDEINDAVHASESGEVLKPVLKMS